MKTIFLLFLSLPQVDVGFFSFNFYLSWCSSLLLFSQGSTYIYNAYLQPFFLRNEANLDAGIVAMQKSILSFVQEKVTALWDGIWALLTNRRLSQQPSTSSSPNPQLSFLASNAWRSALKAFQPTMSGSGTASRGVDPTVYNGAESSRSSTGQETSTPPFPVPQHSE